MDAATPLRVDVETTDVFYLEGRRGISLPLTSTRSDHFGRERETIFFPLCFFFVNCIQKQEEDFSKMS